MSVSIRLRNGRTLQAEVLSGDLFEATLASGKVKIYSLSELLSVSDVDDEVEVTNKKEENKIMYHYNSHLYHINAFPDTEEQFW